MSEFNRMELISIAYNLLLEGAESKAEDWIDEDGYFDEEDAGALIQYQFKILDFLSDPIVEEELMDLFEVNIRE
jgi:hypothetical protein